MKPVDFWSAVRNSVLTPFVFIVAVLVAVLLTLRQGGDALFLASTITANSVIALVQELRAKSALRALELLTIGQVRRCTDQGYEVIPLSEIRVGDHLEINTGEQIPADGVVLEAHSLEIDESLITGESQEVIKSQGNHLIAGSAVIAGKGIFQVEAVGSDSQAGRTEARLRRYSLRLTPIQRSLARLIRWLTYAAIALSALVVFGGHERHTSLVQTVSTIVAGALTLVPEGLVLAATLLFSYGALKLSHHGILTRQLTALEGFGRLNTLCFDKTGTLTERTLALEDVHPFFPYSEHRLKELTACFVAAESTLSPTLAALADLPIPNGLTIGNTIQFSSRRKFSALQIHLRDQEHCLALGAPEILASWSDLTPHMHEMIKQASQAGFRVLLLLDCGPQEKNLEQTIRKGGHPAGMIILRQSLRQDISEALFYLQSQGISLKVLSGDSGETVAQIAHTAGILGTERILTGEQLAELDEVSWQEKVPKTTIFARVLPEQKERLIRFFQKSGFTGMVGDGVNDALALKQADLSIALRDGSPLTRQVADVVLLDDSFSALPQALRLGATIILALEMVACLFFNKAAYGLTVLLWSLSTGGDYPFTARHLLIINFLCIGLPALLWSLLPPEASFRMDSRHFFKRTLQFALPNGLITGLILITDGAISRFQGFDNNQVSAFCIAALLGILSFRLIPYSLKAVDTALQRRIQWFYSLACLVLLSLPFAVPAIGRFFELGQLDPGTILRILCFTAAGGYLQFIVLRRPRLLS